MRSRLRLGILLATLFTIALVSCAAPSSESFALAARLRRNSPTPMTASAAGAPASDARNLGLLIPNPETVYNGFVQRVYANANGQAMTYFLHVPPASGTTRYPVVLLLQGVGERSTDTASPAQNRDKVVDTPYIRQWTSAATQNQWPSFVIVPQVQGDNRWTALPSKGGVMSLPATPYDSLALAKAILDQTEQEYRATIDRSRIYVTGISMGGAGTWDAIERWPQSFSAAAPVAGPGDPTHAAVLTNMPIWVFQGALDTTEPPVGARTMIAAVQAAGGHPLYTEYPDQSHVIWLLVYGSPSFMMWLFAQRKAT